MSEGPGEPRGVEGLRGVGVVVGARVVVVVDVGMVVREKDGGFRSRVVEVWLVAGF